MKKWYSDILKKPITQEEIKKIKIMKKKGYTYTDKELKEQLLLWRTTN